MTRVALSSSSFFRNHRWFRRSLIGITSLGALYTVIGFLVAPAVARRIAQRELSALLHREVTIEQIRLNPYALSATVRGVRIRDREGGHDLFSLKEIYVNVQLATVWKGGPVVRQVRIVQPAISVVRTSEDRYSFSDILDELAKRPAVPPSPPDPAAKPARFSISNIELVDGHLELDDRFKGTRHEIAAVNLSVPFVSNFPYLLETFVQPAFSAVINGTRLSVQGRTKPFTDSLESSIDVNLKHVDLPYYLAYVPMKLRMKLRSAILDTGLKVTFIQYRDRGPRVDISGGIVLSALEVRDDHDQELLSLPLLDVEVASSDLTASKLTLRKILLREPAVHVRRGKQAELQFQTLLAPDGEPTAAPASPTPPTSPVPRPGAKEEKSQPFLLELGELAVERARIVFSDESNPKRFEATVAPLNVTLRDFSTARGVMAKLALAATTDAGEHLTVDGQVGAEPVAFHGTLALDGVPLSRYAPYYAPRVLFDIRKGDLDVRVPVKLAVKKSGDLDLTVSGFKTVLRDLQLRRRGDRQDFLRLPELTVSGTDLDLGRREVTVGAVDTSGARIQLERPGKDQSFNVETLVPPPPLAPRHAAAPRPALESDSAPVRQPPEKPFTVLLQKLDLRNWSVRVEDRSPGTPAVTTLDRVGLRVEHLGTARGQTGRIHLQARLNQSGNISIAGTLGLAPVQASAEVQLGTIPIVPLQPYFRDSVALLVTSGHVGANGQVTFASDARGSKATYKGEVALGELVATDREGTEELLRVGALRVHGIDLVTEPLKVNVGEISLADWGTHVVLNPDQTVNLAAIVPPDSASAPSPSSAASKPAAPAPKAARQPAATTAAGAAAPPNVRIGAIALSGGKIKISDRSIRPAFETSLANFGGRISGLSFDEGERATLDLRGRLGDGPLEISGRLNPLARKKYIDLTFKLSDLDLSAMTPYAGKYAGYAVDHGQLYLDLKYLVDDRKLEAKNNVKISQFTFGHAVDSKDATKLPVRLAVSLLKDRHGVIALDVPVSGSLDDPKFSVWAVVWTVVKNLLVKAATSPFALIGSLFGGGEELSWLEFEPGHADISKAAKDKLGTLAKALYERPALKLEVEGHADAQKDLEALRHLELQRKVKAQKVKESVETGNAADVSAVAVSDAEYPKYLKKAYSAEKLPNKPRNALGMAKDIPAPEMERLMLAAISVTQDDLRQLARQRAQTARDQILRAQKVETERVFLVEPRSVAPQRRDNVRDSRVDFRLQ